jgi:hypothetical protein
MTKSFLSHKIETTSKDGDQLIIEIEIHSCAPATQDPDFSITGMIFEKGNPRVDKYMIGGGCIHDDILAVRPDLKLFVDLHLSDFNGVPMHAVANGFYHMKSSDKPMTKEQFCEYYRIKPDQYDVLINCPNQLQYAVNLDRLGILTQWKEQADAGIELLEQMSGKKFERPEPKGMHYTKPSDDAIKAEQERIESGYYSDEAVKARKDQAFQDLINEHKNNTAAKIAKIQKDSDIKLAVLIHAGEKAYNNVLFYHHTNTLAFNWYSGKMMDEPEVSQAMEKIKDHLPEGVTMIDKKGK